VFDSINSFIFSYKEFLLGAIPLTLCGISYERLRSLPMVHQVRKVFPTWEVLLFTWGVSALLSSPRFLAYEYDTNTYYGNGSDIIPSEGTRCTSPRNRSPRYTSPELQVPIFKSRYASPDTQVPILKSRNTCPMKRKSYETKVLWNGSPMKHKSYEMEVLWNTSPTKWKYLEGIFLWHKSPNKSKHRSSGYAPLFEISPYIIPHPHVI